MEKGIDQGLESGEGITRVQPAANYEQFRDPACDGRICDLCDGHKFSLLHAWAVEDYWNPATIPIAVWKCECGLVFLHPVPTGEQLPDQGDWWSAKRKQHRRNWWFKRIRQRAQKRFIGSAKYRLMKDTQKVVPSGRCLDVGCGTGTLLELAAPFYECVGLEMSTIAANKTRDKSFPVIESSFEEAQIEPQQFDLVLMDSVIEHVHSPSSVLTKVNRILKNSGVVVLKTPKFGGPAYHMHKSGWNGFRHGYHTFLFSGEVLELYLRKTRFEVLSRPKRDRILDDVLILWGRKVADVDANPPAFS